MNKRLMWHDCGALYMVEDAIDKDGSPAVKFRTRNGVYYEVCYRCNKVLERKHFSKVLDYPHETAEKPKPVKDHTVMRGEFHIEDL